MTVKRVKAFTAKPEIRIKTDHVFLIPIPAQSSVIFGCKQTKKGLPQSQTFHEAMMIIINNNTIINYTCQNVKFSM